MRFGVQAGMVSGPRSFFARFFPIMKNIRIM